MVARRIAIQTSGGKWGIEVNTRIRSWRHRQRRRLPAMHAGAPLLLVLLLACIVGVFGATAGTAHAQGPDVWPTYLHDSNHTGYNGNFTAFNQTNAGNL